jgi:hypothetical protein
MRINSPDAELPLAEEEHVSLNAVGRDAIEDGTRLALWGRGYLTEQEAGAAAKLWMDWLRIALARVNVGADLGTRAAHAGLTDDGLARLQEDEQKRILNDVHGLIVFEEEPAPLFASASLDYHVGKQLDQFTQGIDEARSLSRVLTEMERLAFDLYSASFFESSADARFVMLMMALETLTTQGPRSPAVIEHVETLRTATETSGLEAKEKQSIISSLNWLRIESLTSAGTRLVTERLDGRRYAGEPVATFFKRSYELRHKLVHGHHPRPSRADVDMRAAELERCVGDLIAAPSVLPRDIAEPTNW